MRARSGAIHCDSQEDFLELAQASQHRTNIFYDEKINKKVMERIRLKNTQSSEIESQIANPELSSEKSRNSFNGFDFGLESQEQLEQKKQISKINELYTSQLDIGIVIDQKLIDSYTKELTGDQRFDKQRLNLKIYRDKSTIFRCWYFRVNQSDVKVNILMRLYLERCKMIVQMGQDSLEVLSSHLDSSQQAVLLKWIKSQPSV